MKKSTITKILASLLIYVGYSVLVLPFSLDQISRINQTSMIGGYEQEVNKMTETELEAAKQRCEIYNQKIFNDQQENYYHYSNDFDFSEDYITWPTKDSDIATLIIPKIDMNLPIGHGTEEDTLQIKAGHLYGTSLPCGGESTHAVISGHTALRTSKMFDRVSELKIGDEIQIKILNEIHVYKVDQIEIVLPEEHDKYLQVEEGKDYITLYTCTPYGINTHRLLVRAERVGNLEVEHKTDAPVEIKTNIVKPVLILSGTYIIPLILLIILNCRKGGKEREKN